MKIITAIGNQEISKKIKENGIADIINTDIQYQEAVIEIIEKNKDINLLILSSILPDIEDNTGIYMLKFYTEPYFLKQGLKSIYPFVEVIFRIEGKKHYHIPITMSANGYSTYRGN